MSNMKAGKLMREGEKQMKKSKKCMGVTVVFFSGAGDGGSGKGGRKIRAGEDTEVFIQNSFI